MNVRLIDCVSMRVITRVRVRVSASVSARVRVSATVSARVRASASVSTRVLPV